MITAYHRPQTLDEALKLLAQPNILPLGGGTLLSHSQADSVQVVDLQALGLNTIKKNGNNLEIGATATLQQLLENEALPAALKSALKLEAPLNLRNAGTAAGTIVACDGRSTFVAMLLALDAKIEIRYSNLENRMLNIGDFLPLRPRGLITSITIPLNAKSPLSMSPARPPTNRLCALRWHNGPPVGRGWRSADTARRRCWPWTGPNPKGSKPPHATHSMKPTMNGLQRSIVWM